MILTSKYDEIVKSHISPPLVGGDKGEGEFSTFYETINYNNETFEKCSISFKFKEGENLNRRNTLSISRIKI